ncbi:hypothetical protein COLO4_35429, partial [Corchorus olitorius]
MIDIEIDMEDGQHEDSSEQSESVENNDITGSLDEGRVPREYFLGKDDFNLNVEDVKKMEFDSLIDAEQFYYTYAHGMGFSMSKGKLRRNLQGELTRRELLCSKQGYREDKFFHLPNRKCKPKSLSRCGCEGKFRVVYNRLRKKWLVIAFNAEQNHNLALRAHMHYLRSN